MPQAKTLPKLTERQSYIKDRLDKNDSIADIAYDLEVSRTAVYNVIRRLKELCPGWEPKATTKQRPSSRKRLTTAAPREKNDLGTIRVSITEQKDRKIGERNLLNDEIERLTAAEAALL